MAEGGTDPPKESDILANHEEQFDYPCTRCERKFSRQIAAECFCKTCRQHFCAACRILHGEFVGDHDVVKVAKAKSKNGGDSKSGESTEEDQIAVSIDTEDCHLHSGQQITMYCSQHEAFCCAGCSTLDHSMCEKKDFIPDLAKNISESDDLTAFVNSIDTVQTRLLKVREEKNGSQTSLADSRADYKTTMAEFRTKVEALLQELEKATNAKMENLYKSRSKELQKHLGNCNWLIKEFQDLKAQLSYDTISDAKRFVLMKNGKERILQCIVFLNALSQPKITDIVFSLDKSVLIAIEKLKILGEFGSSPGLARSLDITGVTNNRECKIRADSDKKTCKVQGICALPDGTIILSDHDNKNIKRLDESYFPKETCYMPGSPHGICCIDTKEIAVALGSSKKVNIVAVTDKMRITEELAFEHKCHSIAYARDVVYITSIVSKPTLYEYTLERSPDGSKCTLTRTFSEKSPVSVAVSMDGSFVYAVGNLKKLTIRNRSGGLLKAIEHDDMKKNGQHPCVCVDMKGNVLVSLQTVGILHFKNCGAKPNGLLMKNSQGILNPQMIFVDILKASLIVHETSIFGGSDAMHVFDLVY